MHASTVAQADQIGEKGKRLPLIYVSFDFGLIVRHLFDYVDVTDVSRMSTCFRIVLPLRRIVHA